MAEKGRILIVDGDPALRQTLIEQLEIDAEFAGAECGSGAAALRMAATRRFDAVLLGSDLPDMEGCELCRRLREGGTDGPVLVMTAARPAPAPDDCVDAYFAKPFRLNDVLAQLRERLSQRRGDEEAVAIGPFTFRPRAKLMADRSGGRTVRLTEKETAILTFLHRAGGAVERDTLLGEVWGYSSGVATHTLETHVYRLRRKIERDASRPEILLTAPGGYRLAARSRPLPRKSRAI